MVLNITTTRFKNKKITCPECEKYDITFSKYGMGYLLRINNRYKEFQKVSMLLDYVNVFLRKRNDK